MSESFAGEYSQSFSSIQERRYPLLDNASLLLFRTGLGYGSTSFPIEPRLSATLLVCADRMKIEQVIDNLLTNAIKHTPERGTISILAENNAGKIIYSIENTGSHIPEEEIDSIWDMFYRGRQNGRKDGSGLGLAIVKKVFELHNIKHGVRSTETGVCFFFTLESCPVI
jgi:signal transduction histidine kinase